MMLKEGDIIRRIKGRRAVFVIDGFTPRGKVKCRNVKTGSIFTAWWTTRASVPSQYKFINIREENDGSDQ
jgi:hypothetical protein